MVNLGNCTNGGCTGTYACFERTKYRMVGDRQVLLDVEGRDITQDPKTKVLSGRPAKVWVVRCPDCGFEPPDHPYLKTIQEATQPKPPPAAIIPAPTPPAPVVIVNRTEERLAKIERMLADLADRFDKIESQLAKRGKGG